MSSSYDLLDPDPDELYIPEVFEQHLDELGFLWGRRRTMLRSANETLRTLRAIEERIDAHLDGMLTVAQWALPQLGEALQADDASLAFAGAHGLLHLRDAAQADSVLTAFEAAEGDRLDALKQALAHGPRTDALPRFWALLDADDSQRAAAAAEVLAFQGALTLTPAQLSRLLHDAEPSVRIGGWRIAAYLGVRAAPESYGAAMDDEAAAVRAAALESGAWCREAGVLTVARELSRTPSPEHLYAYDLLAVLGTADDLPLLQHLAAAEDLGPARFRLLGAYGSPALIDWVVAGLSSPDPLTAAAAGAAFAKLTGSDIESAERTRVPPADGREPDAFEREFLDEVTLPDAELARRAWAELEPRLAHATRICRGFVLDHGLDQAAFDRLDMESRWELYLRGKFYGGWDGTPLQLEVFP
jgi:uncharacterized protein (TIGR02270 family)